MFTLESDKVLRDNEAIGTLKDGVVTLSVQLAPAHKSKLKKELGDAGIEVTGFAKVEGESGDTENANIPPCPPADPLMGDKTPAVVEWYRDYKPEEFQSRYTANGRFTHLNPRPVDVPAREAGKARL